MATTFFIFLIVKDQRQIWNLRKVFLEKSYMEMSLGQITGLWFQKSSWNSSKLIEINFSFVQGFEILKFVRLSISKPQS